MNDLMWIGNTLYPRWFVIAVPLAIVLTPFLIAGLVVGIKALFKGDHHDV